VTISKLVRLTASVGRPQQATLQPSTEPQIAIAEATTAAIDKITPAIPIYTHRYNLYKLTDC